MPSASALVRSHSRRVLVPERRDFAERLARFSTCRPWPAAKRDQRCADSGMCILVAQAFLPVPALKRGAIAPYLQERRTRCFVFLFCGAGDVAAWGTGVIFTRRLLADACATERQIQKRRPEASGTNGEGEKNDVVVCAAHRDRAALLRWHRQECLCY